MAVVPGVLLDHVEVHPAHAHVGLVTRVVERLVKPPAGRGLALFVTILWALVFANVRSAFAGIFQARVETTPVSEPHRTGVTSPA